jgi:hypothetical protein
MHQIITDTVSIYQLQRTGNTEKYPDAPQYQNVNSCIAPLNTDIQPSMDVAAFQLFEIFVYDVTLTLHNGDKLVNQQTSVSYILSGEPYVVNNRYLQYIRILGKQVV